MPRSKLLEELKAINEALAITAKRLGEVESGISDVASAQVTALVPQFWGPTGSTGGQSPQGSDGSQAVGQRAPIQNIAAPSSLGGSTPDFSIRPGVTSDVGPLASGGASAASSSGGRGGNPLRIQDFGWAIRDERSNVFLGVSPPFDPASVGKSAPPGVIVVGSPSVGIGNVRKNIELPAFDCTAVQEIPQKWRYIFYNTAPYQEWWNSESIGGSGSFSRSSSGSVTGGTQENPVSRGRRKDMFGNDIGGPSDPFGGNVTNTGGVGYWSVSGRSASTPTAGERGIIDSIRNLTEEVRGMRSDNRTSGLAQRTGGST